MAAMRDAGLRALGLLKSIGAMRPSLPSRSAARRGLARMVGAPLLAFVALASWSTDAFAACSVTSKSLALTSSSYVYPFAGGGSGVAITFTANYNVTSTSGGGQCGTRSITITPSAAGGVFSGASCSSLSLVVPPSATSNVSVTCTRTWTEPASPLATYGVTASANSTGSDFDIATSNTLTYSRGPAPPSLNVTKTASGLGSNGTADFGEVISYAITVLNTGGVSLTGVTVDDPLLGGAVSGPTTIAVGATANYAGTYTVLQSDVDNNGGGDGDIDNTVTADSAETGPDTASVAVTITTGQDQHGDVDLVCPDADSDTLCKGGGPFCSGQSLAVNGTDNIDLTNVLAGTLVTVTATNRLAVGTANVDFAGLALSPDPISLAGGETKSATFTSPAGGTSNFQI